MMTSNPIDHDSSDSDTAGIRLAEAARETDNAAWLDDFTIELRLLEVPGAAIGDAVASAREFLSDSGARAEESFGSAARYAVELDLPTLPEDKSSNREVLLTNGIGLIGLVVLGQTSYPLAGGDDGLAVRLWMVVSLGVTLLLLGLMPRVVSVLVRARNRPLTVGLIVAGVSFGGIGPVLLSVWWGQAVLLSIPALPVAIGAGILLLAPAIWNQVRHNLQKDLIIEPGTGAATLPSRGVRLLAVGANWIMVVYGAISFVLTFALYPSN